MQGLLRLVVASSALHALNSRYLHVLLSQICLMAMGAVLLHVQKRFCSEALEALAR